jgi:hypothetical protein
VFECNLLQISPLELCFEKLRFFKKMCSQNAGNAISETHILKILPAVLGSHLRRSLTIQGGGQGKWAVVI